VIEPRPPLLANAWSDDGLTMAMRHQSAPVHGVQFHPESIASEHGHALLGAFLRLCAGTA
jgi:anthranilate synthase component 2